MTNAQKGFFPPFRNNPVLLTPARRRLIRDMNNLATSLREHDAPDETLVERVKSIPGPAFADFVLSAFAVTGHHVERFSQLDELSLHGAVQLGKRKYLVRGLGSPDARDRAMHVSRAVDRLATECRGRGLSGLFVSPNQEIKPRMLMEVSKQHFKRGFTLSMMCAPDIADLLQGRCVRDPLKGFFLVYGDECDAPNSHPHHAYFANYENPWWSPTVDKTLVPYPHTVAADDTADGAQGMELQDDPQNSASPPG